jgi:3-oxoacyl-[acyl-carrier protein] reductase
MSHIPDNMSKTRIFTIIFIHPEASPDPMQEHSSITGKVALVTGAASGIGKALTTLLSRHGVKVLTADISPGLSEMNKLPGVSTVTLDVRKGADWEKALKQCMKEHGRIDWLFNVAGVVVPGYIHEVSIADIDRTIDINLKGTLLGCQVIVPQLVRQGSGHIVNISSMAGLAPVPGLSLYVASKFAVRGFSLAIALELQPKGVDVTVVCPDATQTHMLDEQIDYPQAALTFSGDKVLSAEEVATAILERGIIKKERELWLPVTRGITAMASNVFPGIAEKILPILLKKGMKNQKKFKG